MSHFQNLSEWMAALTASLPFAIALPILLAIAFATLADWFDHYLTTYRHTPSRGRAGEPRAERESHGMTPSISPAFKAGSAHNADRY